jgi:twitching motility protein PilT
LHQGLVLVCGPTGSGKSTTLAAMIDHINTHRPVHIITLEDPIEYAHKSKTAKVTQREVGKSTTSFTRGLRASLREDPDIVLVGELRDRETLELAFQTAQTGHLVFGTLHTSTAIGTIDRMIDMFPVEQHNQIRSVLADTLKGVINQHLCKRIGGGRVAAYELLMGGSAVSNCIRQAKSVQIATIMTTNRSEGHRHLNDELYDLVRKRQIEPLEALKHTDDRKDMKVRLGIVAA